jgi:actin-related protein
MRPTRLTSKVLAAFLLSVFATTAYAIEPIPKESGFSGFVNAGAAYLDVENNMIAGNDLGDVGKDTIGSIFDSPDSESDVIPILNAEVRYTFASTRTQLFVGNRLEDFLRFDLATLAGVKQELPDESILSVAYVFSAVPTEVFRSLRGEVSAARNGSEFSRCANHL